MFRRCLTLLVIVGFLANQMAAIPHSHGAASAGEQRKHNATPHFHSEWFGYAEPGHSHSEPGHSHSEPGHSHSEPGHSHSEPGHSHSDPGHSHSGHGHPYPGQRHEGGQEAPTSVNSDGLLLDTCLSGPDHDSDAIFVSERVVAAFKPINPIVAAWQIAVLAVLPNCLGEHKASPSPSFQWHPPDKVLDASDTYLTLRNLRL